MSTSLHEDDIWNILENFFIKKGVVHQQLDSYNDFVNNGVQEVIDEEADITMFPAKTQKYVAHFGSI